MKIILHQIPEGGAELKGEVPVSVLEVQEPFFRFDHPIQYQLDALWTGKDDLLVTGKLSLKMKARCVRSMKWFDLLLETNEFRSHHTDLKGDEVDLTEEIREDILMLLPANPISPNAKPLEATPQPKTKSGNEAWGELDKLKLKKK